ncbi:MAG: (d)CMP kinase [Flavobacteriales bacterium]|nr:(d)CMP kinase [Flavobacteriales bacterium]MCB9364971.1 (d)CMP kinase [Flavobacteriales bacterium]
MRKIIIAIDGYSSCGKSTLAKQIARELNYVYIDTGAMYRAVSLYAVQKGYIVNNVIEVTKLLEALPLITISFSYNLAQNKSETFLNGVNVEQDIRTIDISNHVSRVAQIKEVREKMVELQRAMGDKKGLVMDGRDIGSVVFPNAELKLFMTASPKIRAQRRYDELKAKGDDVSFEDVMANIVLRDNDDTSRTENPLIKAPDAIVIDNSNITQEEQFELAINYAKKIIG